MPFPALLAAAAPLVGSALSSYTSYRNSRDTIDANMRMWRMQNEYNSPKAQMQRLKDAGLNPNLVYGSGTVAGNQAGPAPRFDYSYEAPDLSQGLTGIAAYADLRLKAAQTDNVEAQTNNINQRTVNEGIREYLYDLEGRRGDFELETRQKLFPYQLEVQKGDARKVDAQVEQEFQRLMNMRREELQRMLESMRSEKQLSIMSVEQEQKEADLLFARYRNQWMAAGVTTSDNPLLRLFVRMANDPDRGGSVKQYLDSFLDKYRPKNLSPKH